MLEMNDILEECIKRGASDIHLAVGRPVTLRVHGVLVNLSNESLKPSDTEALMKSITSDQNRQRTEEHGGVDFGFAYGTKARYRVSVFKQKGVYGVVLRMIPTKLLSFEEIGLAKTVVDLLYRHRGLILVTGPTGCGKSTTLATMIDFINQQRDCHIISIEDPIEYFHDHKKSIVSQREIGVDVATFSEALVKALRQDPDVILVGEMRDLATMEAAITAAETGHLVFATLHTTGAARTVDRIIDAFPAHQQEQIRTQLSVSLIAVVSQILIPKIGGGRVAAHEVMITTAAIGNLIRENKTFRITSDIQTGAKHGMYTMDSYLLKLFKEGKITYEDMIQRSYDPEQLALQAGGVVPPKTTAAAGVGLSGTMDAKPKGRWI